MPPYPMAQLPAATNWSQAPKRRMTSKGKIALIGATALILVCCGVTGIVAMVSPDPDNDATAIAETAQASTATDRSRTAARGPAATPGDTSPTAATSTTTPAVQTRTVTETQKIPYRTKTVNDPSLSKGTRKVTTRGVAGVRTLTYRVTLTDGTQTAKTLIKSEVTRAPVTQIVRIGTKKAAPQCDPNYSGACVPIASDVDCAGGSGNGPAYVEGPVRIIGKDIYDLDGNDNDGIGCED